MSLVLPESSLQVALARQPIVDVEGSIVGYELLWRSAAGAPPAPGYDGDAATAATVLAAVADIGLDDLVGDRLAFVNLTPAFLDGRFPLDLDPARVVLEVLESVEPTPDVVAGVARLAARGFRLALDDFAWGPGCELLLPYMWAVKLDVLAHDEAGFLSTARRLSSWGVVLLAEKVETREHAELAGRAGCSLAQGWLYARPELVRSAVMRPGAAAALHLAATLATPEVAIAEVVRRVAEQPALSMRLLRLAGSAANGRGHVRSLAAAVSIVGLSALERWVLLAALAEQGEVEGDTLVDLLVPARMCELLAPRACVDPGEAFLVGLMDSMASLLTGPVESHLISFGLPGDVVAAVVHGAGALGVLLGQVRAWLAGETVAAPGGPDCFAISWGRAVGWSSARADALSD